MKLKSRKIISMALVFFMMLTILPLAPMTAYAAGTSGGGITLSGDLSDWNIKISDEGVLSWDAQASATKYELEFYENPADAYPEVFIGDLTTNSCDLKAAFEAKKIEHNGFNLSINALNGTTTIRTTESASGDPDISVWYVSSLPKLSEPHNLTWDGYTAKWDSVPNATGYKVTLYYNNYAQKVCDVTSTEFNYEGSGVLPKDGWWFEVEATCDGYRNSNAAESPKYGTPSLSGGITLSGDLSDWNIKISDEGVLSWDAQASATKYELEFYENPADAYPEVFIGDLTTNSCDLKAAFEAKKIEHNGFNLSINALNGTTTIRTTESASGDPDISVWYVSSLPKLSEPHNLTWDGYTAKWDSVPDATGYKVTLYYNNYAQKVCDVTSTEFNYEGSGVLPKDGWWFTVEATCDGYRNSNAAESPKYGEEVVTPPATTYTITATAGEGGTVTQTGSGTYSKDDAVTVAAIPNTGYEFVEWQENGVQVSTQAVYSFGVEGNRNLVAVFKAKDVTPPATTCDVLASVFPAKSGTTTGTGRYNTGDSVTVTATAKEGYVFKKWVNVEDPTITLSTNPTYTFTVNENIEVNAIFEKTEGGDVTPPATTCDVLASVFPLNSGTTTGTGRYNAGDSVTVTATANEGYVFKKWVNVEDPTITLSTNPTYTFTANENTEVTAMFEKVEGGETPAPTEYTITATAGENGTITPSGDVKVTEGENQTFTITANDGYHIKDVKVNGASVGAVSTYTFEDVAANATIVAEFEKNTVVVVNHSVKFDYNDGSAPTTILVAHNDVVSEPADPTREGYIFKGWFLGETEYDFATKVTGPITLTAKWEEHTHAWGGVTYTWAEDGSSCTAERVCTEDSTHKETATATITSAVKTPATETEKGTTTYTATFAETWAVTQTKDIQDIPVLTHTHTYATEWTTDRSNHWHKATCGHDVIADKAAHSYGGDRVCDICNYKKPSSGGSYGGGSYVAPDKDADNELRIVMQINNKNILVNGSTITNDVAPVIVGDRTLVPIRVVTELLGGSAHWDNATRTVTLKIDGKTMNMTIGKPIPGFGTSAVIMNDRTYVPVRYVMEKLGAEVEWINATRQIIIEK